MTKCMKKRCMLTQFSDTVYFIEKNSRKSQRLYKVIAHRTEDIRNVQLNGARMRQCYCHGDRMERDHSTILLLFCLVRVGLLVLVHLVRMTNLFVFSCWQWNQLISREIRCFTIILGDFLFFSFLFFTFPIVNHFPFQNSTFITSFWGSLLPACQIEQFQVPIVEY